MSEETTKVETMEVETTETPQVEIPTYFQAVGATNEEEFNSKIETFKSLAEKQSEIETLHKEWNEKLSIARGMEADPDPEIIVLQNFKSKGIPTKVANEILALEETEVEKNPLKTLLLAEAATNPNYQRDKDLIEKALRETYGLDEEGEYTPTARMTLDARRAVEKINQVKEEAKAITNPIAHLRETIKAQEESFRNTVATAAGVLESIASSVTEVVDKQGDYEFPLKVTKEDVDAILKDKESIAAYFPNANTKEGKEAITQFVKERILMQKYKNGEIFQAWKDNYAADTKREVVKEVLSGSARTPDRGSDNKGSKTVSPILEQARRDGIPIPEGF